MRGYDGRRRDISSYGATKVAAIRALEAKISDVLAEGSGGEINRNSTLPSVANAWLNQVRRTDSGLSQATVKLYEGTVDRYLTSPTSPISGLTLTQLNSVSRLRGFLQSVADHNGSATAVTTKSVLSNILDFAMNDGAIQFNAARQVRRPRSENPRASSRDTRRSFTRGERSALMAFTDTRASALGLDPRSSRKAHAIADLTAFMLGTGVRIGEALALRWEHVHLEHGFVEVHGTKSRSARRRIDLPPWLTQRLAERIQRASESLDWAKGRGKKRPAGTSVDQEALLDAWATNVGEVGFVFSSPGSFDPEARWDPSNCSNAIRRVLDEAGFGWATSHAFRRTAITLLGEAGIPLAKIADFAGHADPAMTASVYLGRDFDGSKAELAAHL